MDWWRWVMSILMRPCCCWCHLTHLCCYHHLWCSLAICAVAIATIFVVDPHHSDADLDPNVLFTMMHIRILLLLTLMRIRIRILHITLIQILTLKGSRASKALAWAFRAFLWASTALGWSSMAVLPLTFSLWCGSRSGSCFSLRCRSGSRFSVWCGSGSG